MKVQVQKLHTLTGHRDSIYTLEGSSTPSLFFSASGDGMIVSWDLQAPETGQLIAHLPNSIYALHYHKSSNLLIAGHNYEGIHIIDWENRKEVGSLQLTKSAIFSIESHDKYYLVGTGDGQLIVVDAATLNVRMSTQLSSRSIRSIAVSPDQSEIAIGYSDNYIRVLDWSTLKPRHEWVAHANSVFAVRYSPDGKQLFSVSRDARLKVWNREEQYALKAEVVAHIYAINHLDFSPDGKHFVTCSMDRSIKVWDTVQVKLLKVIDRARHAGHGTSVNRVLWTQFQDQILSASDDRTISVWNINFDKELI